MTGVWLAALRWGPARVSTRKERKELGPLGGSSRSPAGAGVGAEGFPEVDWGLRPGAGAVGRGLIIVAKRLV